MPRRARLEGMRLRDIQAEFERRLGERLPDRWLTDFGTERAAAFKGIRSRSRPKVAGSNPAPAIAGSAGAGWFEPVASPRAGARLRSARTWAATVQRRSPGALHCPVRPRLSSLRASRGRCKARCCPWQAHRDAGFAVAACRGSAWACPHLAGSGSDAECRVVEGVEARGWHAPNRCDGGGRPPPGGR